MAQHRIVSIQYLRAFAALAVVAHHTDWSHTMVGASGVDLFFVISGFVMMHVSGRESDPATFLRARALRLVPLYWLLTLAWALSFGTTADRLLTSLAFWPWPNAVGNDAPVLSQGWSLNYEVFFYLLFALALLLPARTRLPALTAVFAGLVGFGMIRQPTATAAAVYTSPILLEFVAGAWIRDLYGRGMLGRSWQAAGLLLLGVALLLVQLPHEAPFGVWRALYWGGPCALIAAGSVGLEAAGWMRPVPWLKLLGDASYSIYLIQWFVLGLLVPHIRFLPSPAAVAAALVACAAAGVAVHFGLERPLQTLGKRWRLVKPPRAVASSL